MDKNTEIKNSKDIEALFSLFTEDREAFLAWEKEKPDEYFKSILAFVFEDSPAEAEAKYAEYQASENKETFRLKFYLTLQIAFDQEIKRRGLVEADKDFPQ